MYDIRLAELREYNDLSQEDLAKVLHISRQLYSYWELKTRIIPLKHLNTLCNYYNVSMDYMLNLSSDKNMENIIKLDNLDKKEIGERIKIFRTSFNHTLRSLAKELNTTSSTISAYETGKTLLLTAFAYQICKNYNVSLDWLCGRRDRTKKRKNPQN